MYSHIHPQFVSKAALAKTLAAFLSVYSVLLQYSGIVWTRSTGEDTFYRFSEHFLFCILWITQSWCVSDQYAVSTLPLALLQSSITELVGKIDLKAFYFKMDNYLN